MLPSGGKATVANNTAATDAAAAVAAANAAFVTEIADNDIILGRGRFLIQRPGNVAFRELVRTRKADYAKAANRNVKDKIARELLDQVTGRFLRKIDSIEEARELGIPEHVVEAWKEADEAVALEKIKQTLRDKDYHARKQGLLERQASTASSGEQLGAGSALMPPHYPPADDGALMRLMLHQEQSRIAQVQHELAQMQQRQLGGGAFPPQGQYDPLLEQQLFELRNRQAAIAHGLHSLPPQGSTQDPMIAQRLAEMPNSQALPQPAQQPPPPYPNNPASSAAAMPPPFPGASPSQPPLPSQLLPPEILHHPGAAQAAASDPALMSLMMRQLHSPPSYPYPGSSGSRRPEVGPDGMFHHYPLGGPPPPYPSAIGTWPPMVAPPAFLPTQAAVTTTTSRPTAAQLPAKKRPVEDKSLSSHSSREAEDAKLPAEKKQK